MRAVTALLKICQSSVVAAMALSVPVSLITASPLPAQLADLPGVTWHTIGNPEDGDPLAVNVVFPAKELPFIWGNHGEGSTSLRSGNVTTQFTSTGEDPEGDTPMAAAFSADGSEIIVAHRDSKNLIVFDAGTREFIAEIPLSGSPNDMAITPDGSFVVTANIFEGTASIVDMSSMSEIAVVTVGNTPGVVRISPDGSLAVVGNTVDGTLSVIDIAAAAQVRLLADAGFVASMTFAFETGAVTVDYNGYVFSGNNKLVFPDYFDNSIKIYNITTGAMTRLSSADHPRGIASSGDGSVVAVTHVFGPNTVSVVDPATETITKTINTGVDVWGPITLDPAGTKAVAGIQNACIVVNLVTDAVSSSINTASVYDILTTSDGQYALGVGYRGSLISFATESLVKNLNNVVSTPVGAVSPTEPRAALFSNVFGEDMVVLNTDGASGFLEEYTRSGPLPEGDKCRTVALTPDGSKTVAVNIFSDTATIIDSDSLAVLGFADTGERPGPVAVTPDGSKAVVCNLDSFFATVVDLDTATSTTIPMGRRAGSIQISPDGVYAYLAVVADGDGVYRLNLNTMSQDGAKLITGNMGGVGFLYSQTSGTALSHDGTVLAVCGSFDDKITLIDTVSWSVITNVIVGDFPTRAVFSADDSLIYVSNRDSDNISVIQNAGGASSVVNTFAAGDSPFEMVLTADGNTLYVLNTGDQNVGVYNAVSGLPVATIPLPNYPAGMFLDPAEQFLYVATGTSWASIGSSGFAMGWEGELNVIDAVSNTISESINTDASPSQLTFNNSGTRGAIASPVPDGVVLISVAVDCPGDLDGDNDVDQSDLGILLSSYNIDDGGDIDGDGDTDQSDLGILLANYNTNC